MDKNMMKILGVLALVGSGGCLPTYDAGNSPTSLPPVQQTGPQTTAGASSDQPTQVTPLAPASQVTAWNQNGDPALTAQAAVQPLNVTASQHSCMKMKYATVGNLLANRGVNMTNAGTSILPVTATTNCSPLSLQGFNPDQNTNETVNDGPDPVQVTLLSEQASYLATISQPAKFVYCDAALTLGLPQYGARLAEATDQSTASGTKLFDLFASAAAEIVANIGNATAAPACVVNGQPATLFNADNSCNATGITCLQGYPATEAQLALCNQIVQSAVTTPATTATLVTTGTGTDLVTSEIVSFPVSSRTVPVAAISATQTGQRLAVAAILSAVQTCE